MTKNWCYQPDPLMTTLTLQDRQRIADQQHSPYADQPEAPRHASGVKMETCLAIGADEDLETLVQNLE